MKRKKDWLLCKQKLRRRSPRRRFEPEPLRAVQCRRFRLINWIFELSDLIKVWNRVSKLSNVWGSWGSTNKYEEKKEEEEGKKLLKQSCQGAWAPSRDLALVMVTASLRLQHVARLSHLRTPRWERHLKLLLVDGIVRTDRTDQQQHSLPSIANGVSVSGYIEISHPSFLVSQFLILPSMSRPSLQFLRPCLSRSFRPLLRVEHARVYTAVQWRLAHSASDSFLGPHDVEKQKRLDQLRNVKPLEQYHPRLTHAPGLDRLTIREFNSKYDTIQETQSDLVSLFATGRVRSVRLAGSKLMFLDIERDTQRVQAMIELKKLVAKDASLEDGFKAFKKIVRNGDWVAVQGNPTRTPSGQLTLSALDVPKVLAPCLHHVPDKIEDPETLARRPHIHSLTSEEPADVLRLRALVYDYIRNSLMESGFLEVETPILEVKAGGAIARPFDTVANEMSNMHLTLRIAPELSLKRLIVGGQDRIFEIGRVFRNEGVDNTHNPEFSICEFYEVGATLPALIERTEKLIHDLHVTVESLRSSYFPTLTPPEGIDFSYPFAQLPFIPTIERMSGRMLPDLAAPNTLEELQDYFHRLSIPLPPNANVPRLLDALAEKYIEPLCQNPTFITQHPEALSPLSKSYVDEATGQRVASRVELFINGREYVNAYEEENSPFEQRRKFVMQQDFHQEGDGKIDESYLETLEWGMPPTGGWGCGLDRLVMLFANKKRIADVLPFGTLRNVASISKTD
ncbi:class II aaRS and biotin synthetase [Aaosphaeria arxii CBS 175.79]|uniref:Lysyl-tRNA synthetase n=1 Tax=Aaosphaeria arxii CBS 175.79 TaxID=1450172 RepID=A0A6A5XZS8_9PLEO|nr:class II aaRS and biotin synthetase [Aaosphaeria arxii CBS 175.79]KAF2017794.1 class II aaRS and biotin synthetase [Aaosphaeria arxii CBS 175.79]